MASVLARTGRATRTAALAVRRAAGGAVGATRRSWRALPPWLPRWGGRIAVAIVGAALGMMLGARTTHEVGPFEANLSLTLSVRGDTVLRVPPLGTLGFDSHDAPVSLRIELTRLNQAEAEELIRDPRLLRDVGDRAAADVRTAVMWLVVKAALCGLTGATLLTLLVYRRRWETLVASGLAAVVLVTTALTAATTWRPESLREPTYTGLLANAPTLVGSAQDILDRFDLYQQELAALVTNVSRLYAAATTLPAFQPDDSTIRVLHVSDLHLNPTAFDIIQSVVDQYDVDIVADTGDITDWGSEPESRYVAGIGRLGVPYVFIRGNHDSARTAAAVRAQRNAVVLNGERAVDVEGLEFVGISDPRFTPDKETRDDESSEEFVRQAGERLAEEIARLPTPPDVALVHDPVSAEPLAGEVPLVLAGHIHHREVQQLDGTLLLAEGSTGGAGLRGLQGEEPTPITCSVLYFDVATQRIEAYDDITIGGLGQTEATIQRHLVDDGARADQPN